MYLGDVFQVRSGLVVARKKVDNSDSVKYNYKQLNLRSINKNGYIDLKELETLPTDELINKDYMTAVGDVIVRLTDPYTAVYITEEYKDLIITSNFIVIKPSDNYNSEFVSYYLNGDAVKKQLYSNMQGSIVKSVNISAFENIELPSLSAHEQGLYANMVRAIIAKLKLVDKLKSLELKLQKSIIDKMSIK